MSVRSLAAIMLAACSCAIDPAPCVGPPGLYVDDACTVVAPDLIAYEPAFTLWADGATKERFVRLPPGAVIDASLPDDWVFPVGTTFYKTFSEDGVRLETRVLRKVRDGGGVAAWEMRAYAWDADQRHVTDVTSDAGCPACEAMRTDVLGTDHDIPSGTLCRECHSASRDVVNGFSAIQLASGASGVTLDALVASGRIAIDARVAHAITIPGDAGERAALGYLHANCAHCHRSSAAAICGEGQCCQTAACLTGLYLTLHVGDTQVADTDAYRTAIGRPAIYAGTAATCRISAGHPDASVALLRMAAARDTADAMPRIATEHVDDAGLALVRQWIAAMPPSAEACPR